MMAHKELLEKMLRRPAVKAAYDAQAEEFALLDELLKARRLQKIAGKKMAEADGRYDEAKRAWEQISEEARKLRPELDPELVRPRWRRMR